MPREAEIRAEPTALLPDTTSLEEGRRRLAAALATIDAHASRAPLVRLVQRVHATDPYAWLGAQRLGTRVFWRDRRTGATRAGTGIAHRIEARDLGDALDMAELLVGEDPNAAAFVSARVDATRRPAAEWAGFGTARVHVPALELASDGATTTLTASVSPGSPAAAAELRERLASPEPRPATSGAPPRAAAGELARVDGELPTPQWVAGVEEILARVAKGEFEKAVLARAHEARLTDRADAVALTRALAAPGDDAFVYLFECGETAFVGASPELLLHRDGSQVSSEALAGTRPRGVDRAEDDHLARTLIASEKDGNEHALVLRHVLRVFSEHVAGEPGVGVREVRKLATVQHLAARVTGTLRPGATVHALARALHPTPAVCGLPVPAALSALTALEPFDRGLYGGPLGVVTGGGTTLAVALRCALVCDRSARLFAGAGIVAGSTATDEWRETGAKLRAFASVLDDGR